MLSESVSISYMFERHLLTTVLFQTLCFAHQTPVIAMIGLICLIWL